MNLFGNQNKKFEKKLKQQFDGLEYKPSESLWDKIAAEIPEDNFENSFAENVNSFEPKANPETWDKIETQLSKYQRNNYRLLWIPLLFLIFGSSVYFGYQFGKMQTGNEQLAINRDKLAIGNEQKDNMQYAIGKKKLEVDNIQIDNGQLAIGKKKLEVGNKQTDNGQYAIGKKKLEVGNRKLESNNNQLAISKKKLEDKNLEKDEIKVTGNSPIAMNKKKLETKGKKLGNKNLGNEKINSSSNQIAGNKKAVVQKNSTSSIPDKASTKSEPGIASVSQNNNPESTSNSLSIPKQTTTTLSVIETTNANNIHKSDSIITSSNSQPIPPIQAVKNNIVDSIAPKNAIKNNSNDDKLTRFSISIISGMNYCYNRLSAPSTSTINFSDNIALRKNIEIPMMDWNGAFLLDYSINSKWRLSTGIMVSNFSQQFQYAIQSPNGNHSTITDPSAKINNPNDSIVNGNSFSNRIKYTWTEIPLFITYSFSQKHKIGIELTTGISYAIISGVDASYVSYDNVGVLVLTDKNGFPGVKNNFFFHFYPTVTYKLNELVQIGIAPTFKYSITSITENNNWVQQQPYFIGLSASLRKKF